MTLRIKEHDDRVVATLDRPEKRNAIDQHTIDALHELCAALEAKPRTLILTGAGGVFAAGADIAQLRDRTADDARRGINSTAFILVHELPMPVIAAIDGYALGGGAELAYAADIRIASPSLRIGNPETGLGIMAAAGATWRLPEIVGDARASELLLTGRMLDAGEALAWGLVSAVHPAQRLLDAAHALADRIAANDPLATRHTKRALRTPRAEHPAIELKLQAELFESDEKMRRMTAFLERRGAPRREAPLPAPKLAQANAPARVGVLGGGRMGAGIAHAFLLAGSRVMVVERDAPSADAAGLRVATGIRRSVERDEARDSALDAALLLDRLETGDDITAFGDCDLVIEAVPEDRALKQQALARAEAATPDHAILASNTSSISIDDLAQTLAHPSRFLGLHFFNPVPASSLVEIVQGSATDASVIDTARHWVSALAKTPIIVRDSPGFASSRLGVMLAVEAIRMLEEGVASASDIDAAMTLGYRHPVGPLRTTDIVGLDVRLAIAEELARELGERFAPPELLRRMVAEGMLGRKSGRGFYDWNEET